MRVTFAVDALSRTSTGTTRASTVTAAFEISTQARTLRLNFKLLVELVNSLAAVFISFVYTLPPRFFTKGHAESPKSSVVL